jgi:hypothetical protein
MKWSDGLSFPFGLWSCQVCIIFFFVVVGSVCGGSDFVVRCVVGFVVIDGGSANELAW